MELVIIFIVLCCVVMGEELHVSELASRLADAMTTTTNISDSQENGLTLFSYIDRLECGAERRWKGNLFTESCSNLKQMGVNKTGLYLLNDKGIAFCDMSKEWNDSQIQMMIGQIRFEDVR